MKIDVEPGSYIVAVSGGVDSMVLLDLLVGLAKSQESRVERHEPSKYEIRDTRYELIVAHFDHGMRADSHLDRKLVEAAAREYGLPFVFAEGELGAKASEATAREARYKFLRSVAKSAAAQAIITAHHQDDVLETAIINMLRGTGRKGLTSLQNQPDLLRPLLRFNKTVIKDYAKAHNLKWREDSTNQDTSYLRNYVRHKIVPRFSDQQKRLLLKHIDDLKLLNADIDHLVTDLIDEQTELDREMFIGLDHAIAREVMAGWLKSQGVIELDSKRLELLVRAAKTLDNNKRIDVDKEHILRVNKDKLALMGRER